MNGNLKAPNIKLKESICVCMFMAAVVGIVFALTMDFTVALIVLLSFLAITIMLKSNRASIIAVVVLLALCRAYTFEPTKEHISNAENFGISTDKQAVQYEFLYEDAVAYIRNIPENVLGKRGAYVSGVLFGDKSGIDKESKSVFRKAGISHILAVSGLHVGALMGFMCFLLQKQKSKTRLPILYLALAVFIVLSGFSPSVLRAGLMMGLYLIATTFGYRYNLLNSLFLAGTIILLLCPYMLFDIGFLLSFTATLGIGLFYPSLSANSGEYGNWIGTGLAMYISCQAVALPVMLYFFEELSLLGVLANLFAVPVVGFALVCGMIGILLYPFGFSYLPLSFSAAFMEIIEYVARVISEVPFSTITTNSMSFPLVMLYYLLLLMPCMAVFKDRKNYYLLTFTTMVIMFISVLF